MTQDQIVDPRAERAESARARARLWLQVALPFAIVVLIAAGLVAGTWYQYQRNRADVLALSQSFVASVEQRVQQQVAGFLRPAADGAATLSAVMPSGDWSGRGRETVEAVGMRLMDRHDQIGLVYVGRGNGDFVMLRRTDYGSIDTKLIRHQDGARRTTWIRRGPEGNVTDVEAAPEDTYDPRTRTWYKGALSTDGTFWSEVYVFFTDKSPGITVARPVAASTRDAVVGVDVRLSTLNDFLADLQSTVRGRAVIVDGRGRVVAAPGVDRMLADGRGGDGGELAMPSVQAVGDPVLSEAYDRTRLRADGSTVVEIDGTRHIVATASLAQVTDRSWRLLLVAPESAFAGFVAANNRRSLLILGAIVLLAAGMAGTLAWQSVRAERTRRRLAAREADHRQQLAMMDGVMAAAADGDASMPADGDPASRLAERLARSTGATRAGIWRRYGDELVCRTLYDAAGDAYTAGTTIERHESPALFDTLDQEIAVSDAAREPRTRDLATCYLTPAGMRGLVSVPVRSRGAAVGAIWLETRDVRDLADESVLQLARLTAGILALRWQADGEPAQQPRRTGPETASETDTETPTATATGTGAPPAAAAAPASVDQLRTSTLAPERARAQREAMQVARQGADSDADGQDMAGATLYPRASVAVVRLLDDAALASAPSAAAGPTVARVIDAADRAAREVGLPYIKLLGARIVAVDGFEETDAEAAAARVAEFALRFREPCAEAFRALTRRPAFSIGIDTGPLMGAAVGFGQGLYDVWGEALEVADSLAAEATAGRIQVSGGSYEALQHRYLLRPLGTYFLERAGEMATYDLRAAL